MSTSTPVDVPPSPMTLGNVLSTAVAVFRRRLGLFLGIALLPVAAQLVLVAVLYAILFGGSMGLLLVVVGPGVVPDLGQIGGLLMLATLVGLVIVVVSGLVTAYAQGLMVNAARETMEHRYPTFAELRALTRGFLGRYLGLYLLVLVAGFVLASVTLLPTVMGLVGAISAVGSSSTSSYDRAMSALLGGIGLSMLLAVALGLVAIAVGVRLVYLVQIAAAEGLRGMAILKRSWALTRGSFWRTLGFLLVISLIFYGVNMVLQWVTQLLLGVSQMAASSSSSDMALLSAYLPVLGVTALLSLAVSIVQIPVMVIFATVMYVDQVRRSLGAVATPPRRPYDPRVASAYGPGPVPPGYGQGPVPPTYGQGPVPPTYGPGPVPPGYGPGPVPPGYGQGPVPPTYGQGPTYGQPPTYGQG